MTEAEQIAELKKELQQQQEQINLLKASSSGFMKNWERILIYTLFVIVGIPTTILLLFWLTDLLQLGNTAPLCNRNKTAV